MFTFLIGIIKIVPCSLMRAIYTHHVSDNFSPSQQRYSFSSFSYHPLSSKWATAYESKQLNAVLNNEVSHIVLPFYYFLTAFHCQYRNYRPYNDARKKKKKGSQAVPVLIKGKVHFSVNPWAPSNNLGGYKYFFLIYLSGTPGKTCFIILLIKKRPL